MPLTKSDYLRGRQCDRRLWLSKHGGVTEPQIDADELWEMREVEGAAVERCVEALYPGAVRIAARPDDEGADEMSFGTDDRAARTNKAIAERHPIFQACLRAGDLMAVVDLLEPHGGGWRIWEVKASTKSAPIHDHDLAFQAEVARRAGLEIVGTGLWLLDSTYVRGPELSERLLMRSEDRWTSVCALEQSTRDEIERQRAVLLAATAPDVIPGSRCKANRSAKSGDRPSACGHLTPTGYCGQTLPPNWAGRLPKLSARKSRALALLDISTLGDGEWTPAQSRMIRAVKSGRPEVDAPALRVELAKLRWPVAYMDFEFDTGMAVPRHVGVWPYARIPFQWSLHVQERPGGALESRAFLWQTQDDPRRAFAEALFHALPPSGSVVAHSKDAEWTVLDQLARALGGEIAKFLRSIRERLFDTMELLQAGYYHPSQNGSYSIKKVAPAILGRGYDDLAIQDGMTAVLTWRQLIAPRSDAETRKELRARLLSYCGRDTILMAEIVDAVRLLVSPPSEPSSPAAEPRGTTRVGPRPRARRPKP